MDRHTGASRRHDLRQELGQDLFRVLIVNPNTAFHRHFDIAGRAHRVDAIGHQPRPLHQDGPECARLHSVRGAAAIKVDLIIARRGPQPRRLRQLLRVRPAQLQCNRMFRRVVIQQMQRAATHQGGGGHHLGVKQGLAAEQTVEVAAVAVGPIHHGCHAKARCLFNIIFQ